MVAQITFTVNITSGPNIETSKIRTPNITNYSRIIQILCSKEIVSHDNDIFSLSSAYYVDICGANIDIQLYKLIESALLQSWIVAHPGITS